ncbi:MAG: AAA family ATPase [Firmicutes bacterium]|nr:AAA family ATPase [Bacillota bacterium]
MFEKIIEAIKKNILDENLKEEIFGSYDQNSDKLFNLCKKHSDEDFTKEEFDFTLSQFFVLVFENIFKNYDESVKISELDLENIAGGVSLKKVTAASLLTLFFIGLIPTGIKNLDLAPKANATGVIKTAKEVWKNLDETDRIWFGVFFGLTIPAIYKLGKWLYKPFVEDVVKPSINWFVSTFIYNRISLDKDPVKFREIAEKFLKENIFAQDKAIEKIVSIMSGYIDMWKESDITGKPCTSGCVMTFIGASGTGKTLVGRLISQLIFNKDMDPVQFITDTSIKAPPTPSDVPKITVNVNSFGMAEDMPSSKTEELSPADQLFHENSKLVRQLLQNSKTVFIIDEIDKIHKKDHNDTILERWREVKDTGILRYRLSNGEYRNIDASRCVFIFISNELPQCWGLPERDFTPQEATSRTTVKRDRSLVNRFDVVEFENFKKDDYMVILKPLISQIKQSYSQLYNMNIEFAEDFTENVARTAEDKNKGARGVNDFLVELRGKLVDCRSKNKILENNSPKEAKKNPVWKVTVKYDRLKETFSVEAQKSEFEN